MGEGAQDGGGGAGARVVLSTFGTYGDLHPFIAIALGLRARGHRVTLAASPLYRAKVEALGLAFHPLRPYLQPDADVVRRTLDPRTGAEVLVREVLLPALGDAYEDLVPAVRGADLLLTH